LVGGHPKSLIFLKIRTGGAEKKHPDMKRRVVLARFDVMR
jgi:hypothetical protein